MRRFLSFLMASDTARWSSKKGEFCARPCQRCYAKSSSETFKGVQHLSLSAAMQRGLPGQSPHI